jgi:Mce-associated membrane protein
MTEQPPTGPDGSALTPQEWDAVRRLRSDRPAEPEPEPEPVPAWTSPEPPAATGEPLPPVEPPPPAEQAAPPAQTAPAGAETVAPAPAPEPPTWGGSHREARPAGASAPTAVAALTALAVLAVVTAVLAALVGLKVSDRHTQDRASTAALSAATSGVATVLSYNYRSLEHDFTTAEAVLTPSFRKAYVATTAKAVQPLAAKYKAVSTAQVSAAGVISATASRATVLVFVSQQVTNTQLSAPRLDRSRIQVELVRTRGRWLINKLTPI